MPTPDCYVTVVPSTLKCLIIKTFLRTNNSLWTAETRRSMLNNYPLNGDAKQKEILQSPLPPLLYIRRRISFKIRWFGQSGISFPGESNFLISLIFRNGLHNLPTTHWWAKPLLQQQIVGGISSHQGTNSGAIPKRRFLLWPQKKKKRRNCGFVWAGRPPFLFFFLLFFHRLMNIRCSPLPSGHRTGIEIKVQLGKPCFWKLSRNGKSSVGILSLRNINSVSIFSFTKVFFSLSNKRSDWMILFWQIIWFVR